MKIGFRSHGVVSDLGIVYKLHFLSGVSVTIHKNENEKMGKQDKACSSPMCTSFLPFPFHKVSPNISLTTLSVVGKMVQRVTDYPLLSIPSLNLRHVRYAQLRTVRCTHRRLRLTVVFAGSQTLLFTGWNGRTRVFSNTL